MTDNCGKRHTVFFEGDSEEAAHGRNEVSAHGSHAGHRHHGRTVADGQDRHGAEEGAADHEGQDLVEVDVDTHVLCHKLVAADRIGVGADLRVVQKQISRDESQDCQDQVARHLSEGTEIGGKGLLHSACDVVGHGLIDQSQAGGDDHGRDPETDIEETVQETDQSAGQDAADDQAGITHAEPGGKYASYDGGEHDVRADGEVEHAHDHDKVESYCTDCREQGCLKIAQKVFRGTEVVGRKHFEYRPGKDHESEKDHISLHSAGHSALSRFFLRRCHTVYLLFFRLMIMGRYRSYDIGPCQTITYLPARAAASSMDRDAAFSFRPAMSSPAISTSSSSV